MIVNSLLMNMGKAENVRKNQELRQHESPLLAPARNISDPGYIAGIGRKSAIEPTVKPFEGIAQERREQIYISRALSGVPRGTSILNWPCGCSRLLPFLKRLGYNVTSADSSSDAVSRIRLYGGLLGEDCVGDKDDFNVVNIFRTGFEDDHFSAVIVNQLFCLPEPKIRQLILTELRRISDGPIVVSFFCNTMIYDNSFCQKLKYREPGAKYSFDFNRRAFAEEIRKSGLIVDKWVPRFSLRKRQFCAVLARDKNFKGSTSTTKS
jgi:hypothetical protein